MKDRIIKILRGSADELENHPQGDDIKTWCRALWSHQEQLDKIESELLEHNNLPTLYEEYENERWSKK